MEGVLAETGLTFEDPWALAFLAKEGCSVDESAGGFSALFDQPLGIELGTKGLLNVNGDWCEVRVANLSPGFLNECIHAVFDEDQIFRIDHYMGKETVQNILIFRFTNGLFEPVWNRRYIDHVQITVAETVGVEDRGGYYDQAGALRDMVQNHLLQLLCLIAMEPPVSFDADEVREAWRSRVLDRPLAEPGLDELVKRAAPFM